MANLHLLDGGVNGWIAAGLPVMRGGKKLSLERQVRVAAGPLAPLGGLLGPLLNPAVAHLSVLVDGGRVFQA